MKVRKMKPTLLSPIYRGNHTHPVNKDAQRVINKKSRKKKRIPKDILVRRNASVHRGIEAQRRLATEILARLTSATEVPANTNCPFCNLTRENVAESKLSVAFLDNFPVSKGHTLVVPKRHISSFWEMTKDELSDALALMRLVRDRLVKRHSPDGFNVGVNCEEAAGQTVFHAHIHLIPRYRGDVVDPRGGVRWILPEKAKCWK